MVINDKRRKFASKFLIRNIKFSSSRFQTIEIERVPLWLIIRDYPLWWAAKSLRIDLFKNGQIQSEPNDIKLVRILASI